MSEEQVVENASAKEKAMKEAAEKNAALPKDKVAPRWKVGSTKGKNPVIITYQNFDMSMPDTLPKTTQEFIEFVGEVENQNAVILDFLLRGYNEAQNEAASDPLAEYVSDVWTPEVKLTFRTAVRNYSKGLGIDLEDAVAIIRPGFAKKFGS